MTRLIGALCLAAGLLPGAVSAEQAATAETPTYPPLDLLLQQSETVIGQPFAYPQGTAKITAALVAMMPGQQTGWHHHEVPLVAYILDGELTVDYGPDGTKTYKAGDTFIEAFQTKHNGTNTGTVPVRILAVFAGADGVPNTVADDGTPAN